MDLSKSYEFFQPDKDNSRIHIVGCGSVGSTIAENLARCGITKMTLWDFDTVESKNVHNQMFRQSDVGKLKVEALKDILMDINPDIENGLELMPEGWNGKMATLGRFLPFSAALKCNSNVTFVQRPKTAEIDQTLEGQSRGRTASPHCRTVPSAI